MGQQHSDKVGHEVKIGYILHVAYLNVAEPWEKSENLMNVKLNKWNEDHKKWA